MDKLLFFFFLLIFFTFEVTKCAKISKDSTATSSGMSVLTPKLISGFLDKIFPEATSNGESRTEEPKLSKTLGHLRKALSHSARHDEGWTILGQRLLSYALKGKEGIAQDSQNLSSNLANEIMSHSPKFLMDSIKVQKSGSIIPTIKEKLAELVNTIKEKQSGTQTVQGKQAVPFDPLVFGVNALINLGWFAAFNAAVLPNMGLNNLFYPDYYYEYEDLEEGEEEVVVEDEGKKEEGKEEGPVVATEEEQIPLQSSYSHYPGQRMHMPPSSDPQAYQYFKMYMSKKHHH